MPADLTVVTELATALGTLPCRDLESALSARPATLRIDAATWDRLEALMRFGAHAGAFEMAYANGRAFAEAPDALAGRPPRLIEWTGGRRPPGDEVAPIDLRIDHVYLVSCKYLSANVANPSPGRLFEGLLATTGHWDRTDWYELVAPERYQELYAACRTATGLSGLPERAADLSGTQRNLLRRALADRHYPGEAREAYRRLCEEVSEHSARRWSARLSDVAPELMAWRLLRIGSAPYFLLGAHGRQSLRLRVDTPADWHRAYRLVELRVEPARAGQPRVDWVVCYLDRATGATTRVCGHVEIRWSHGRFAQPPEAKIYLDTPVDRIPGYHRLGEEEPAPVVARRSPARTVEGVDRLPGFEDGPGRRNWTDS